MTTANGRPMPTAPPITIAIARSKPAIACQDITLLAWKESFRRQRTADQSLSRQVKCHASAVRTRTAGAHGGAIFGSLTPIGLSHVRHDDDRTEQPKKGDFDKLKHGISLTPTCAQIRW